MWKRLGLFALAVVVYAASLSHLSQRIAEHPSSVVYRNLSPFVWLLQGAPVEASFAPRAIRSVQHVTVLTPTTGANTATISSVVPGNSILVWRGGLSSDCTSGGYSPGTQGYGALTNATTVTVTTGSTGNYAVCGGQWQGDVIEYVAQFVKSAGACGVITTNETGVTTGTATIATVDRTHTPLVYTGWTSTAAYVFDGAHQTMPETTPRVEFTNDTTIQATHTPGGTTGTASVGYCYLPLR